MPRPQCALRWERRRPACAYWWRAWWNGRRRRPWCILRRDGRGKRFPPTVGLPQAALKCVGRFIQHHWTASDEAIVRSRQRGDNGGAEGAEMDVTLMAWGPDDLPELERANTPEMTAFLGGPESAQQLVERQERYLRLNASGEA